MGRVCMGRLGNGPSLQWAEFAMGRDVQLPAQRSIHTAKCPRNDLVQTYVRSSKIEIGLWFTITDRVL